MKQARIEAVRPTSIFQRALTPFIVLLAGVGLTTLMASLEQQSAEREQQLLFEQAVMLEQQTFTDGVDAFFDEFDHAVDFIAATFPGTEEQYQRFFANSPLTNKLSESDPGVTLIEPVALDGVEALEAREHALGNNDFRMLAIGPPIHGEHFVITRTARPVVFGGLSLLGLEVGSLAGEGLFNALPQNGRLVYPLAEEDALNAFFERDETGIERPLLVAILESINEDDSDKAVGWATRFFEPTAIVDQIGQRSDRALNVSVETLGVTKRMVDVDSGSETSYADAALSDHRTFETHGLDWTLSMWADESFGVKAGLLDQTLMWTFGLLVTAALAVLAIWRAIHGHRLSTATFELEHARTLASTDPLTGLLNRQGFMELANQAEFAKGGTVFFIDLDGFKAVNDTSGHAEGDRILRDLAHRIREQFRGIDLVSRFGGDEFVVFAPGLVGAEIEAGIAERVVTAVSASDATVSCSVGTAKRVPHDTTKIQVLIDQADEAMYRAKEQGGDRFVRF
ncbi:MAG: diguanylate cyclase (GGDEF)-like protein [Verrucomicrobiales bacterium]